MLKRPKAGESEEDLLEFQRQFLAEKTRPSASVVTKAGDKRKSGPPGSLVTANVTQRDVVQLEGLPQRLPAETHPPEKKSRFKLSQEKAAVKKHRQAETADDPEEMIDKHDTHMAAVLTKIIERDTRNMAVQMPHGIGLGFPTVHQLDNIKKEQEGKEKKKSLFAQQFAAAPENFRGITSENMEMREEQEEEMPSMIEGTGLSATFGRDEAKKIHEENVNKLASMSEEEIFAEQSKLLEMLDPKLVEFLKSKRTHSGKPAMHHVEMHQTSHLPLVKQERKEEKEAIELPLKVEKDWVHMNKIEYDKLEWMKDLPKPQAGDSKTGQQARFDFHGNLIAPDADVPVNVGLHHHGDEPERAGYTLEELFQLCRSSNNQQRTLALQTLGKIIQQAKEGKLSQLIQTPILPSILDAGVIFLLRWSLDDSVDSVVVAAVAALNALLVNHADELSLDHVFHWPQGHRVPAQAPVTPESLGIKLPEVEDEKAQETDADVARKDLILALVSRMSLLPRLRYILDVVKPHAPAVIHILEILVRVARHSAKLAYQVVSFQELMILVVEKFLPLSWASQDASQPLSVVYGVPLSKAMRLVKTLCQAGRNMAAILLSKYKLTDRLLRYLVISDHRNLQLPEMEAYQLQIETLEMWTVCLYYSLADQVYLEIFPFLVEQLKSCQNILEKPRIEQNKLTALIGALQAVVCLAGITIQQKGFIQDRPGGSGDIEMSEERSPPLVNWSHVTDLIHPIKLLLRDTLQTVASNYQIKRQCLQIPSICMDFVTTYYQKCQSKVIGSETINYLEDIEAVYRLCMSHWKSFGFQTILSGLSKYSNLLQPAELAKTEVSSCLPELGSSSLSEDSFLPVICRNSPYNFLLSLLHLVFSFSKLHKGLLTLEAMSPACFLHNDDIWTYLKKIAPGKASHLSMNHFSKFENLLQYNILKLATIPTYGEEISPNNKTILHCVSLTLLTSLHHGDEHLAHDLLSTVVFNPTFWSDPDTELASARLEDLNLLETTPTHLRSATQEDITFTSDQLCKDAISKLASIRATYLNSMSGKEKQVLESRNHYYQNPEVTQSCFTSHIGECMLPRDWMFLPLIELYNIFSSVGLGVQNILQSSQVGTVCDVLRWIYLLETHRPQQLSCVSLTLKLSRIMCVYLTGNDLFLDRSVHCFLAGLLRHYTKPKLLDKIDFTENIPGLSSFYDLYVGLLQQYEAVSFGDSLFGSYILIPLQQCHDLKYRRAIWTEYTGILRTLSVPIQELLLPVERFLQPEESNVEMIRLYYQSLFGESLRHCWCPVLYLTAVHHVNRFMYSQDGKHTKLKKTMMSQILNAKNQELRHHLVYYKQADITLKFGMEFYDELPPIRQNYIRLIKPS